MVRDCKGTATPNVYGRSPGMVVLPEVEYLQQIQRDFLYRIWLRNDEKRAFAELVDWW